MLDAVPKLVLCLATRFGMTRTKTKATLEDLYNVPENGKAELVNGELLIIGAYWILARFGPQVLSAVA